MLTSTVFKTLSLTYACSLLIPWGHMRFEYIAFTAICDYSQIHKSVPYPNVVEFSPY